MIVCAGGVVFIFDVWIGVRICCLVVLAECLLCGLMHVWGFDC